ncbi:hypothetical protein NDA11_002468 [Ustilago hordei]|uniref:Uncharacterized protein n=1 Tax=Ustilago hordei TaxID=120017 RepID=I2G337_USTHO|nr:uncharacterized protein UHO2_02777 [Ustilago hordei]KAJ1040463.1 hypothetical protein NDA10_003679 [Ustilago hordei]KAJ1585608.1 hypothetical protein NDA15_007891 [Ustilago hordei]KAJ1588250.1 hypothetical protein NDA12_005428 [Ustilago hordei]KAJ1592856.1 hypothetical protein NDA11_002468 [Ustilago hordei]KAJ1601566.1 hypothetical protein NDA14_004094 [Ustilago hordei]
MAEGDIPHDDPEKHKEGTEQADATSGSQPRPCIRLQCQAGLSSHTRVSSFAAEPVTSKQGSYSFSSKRNAMSRRLRPELEGNILFLTKPRSHCCASILHSANPDAFETDNESQGALNPVVYIAALVRMH